MIKCVESFSGYRFKHILIIMLIISLQLSASGRDLSVCQTGCDSTSITAALNEAAPGDTLKVHSGIYREYVNVTKTIALIGQDTGSGKPVIDADLNGGALAIFADGVTVEGFNLTNALGSRVEILAGIEVNSNKCILKNNLLFNNENGILIYGHDNLVLANNASNNIYGIRALGADNNTISDNMLANNNYSLFLLNSNNNSIHRNQAVDNGYGILINDSAGNNLIQNRMVGNSYNFGCHGENRIDTTDLVLYGSILLHHVVPG